MATESGAVRFYSRYGNPTVKGFEEAIASLEGAEGARAFASGMGALSAVVLGLCSSGDHIVAQQRMYAGTQLLLQHACPRFGIDVTFVDATAPDAFAEAVRPGKTMLVLAETPANPRLDIVDLDALGAIKGPITVVRLDLRHTPDPATARSWRRPRRALGDQGDRRPQRRHARRGPLAATSSSTGCGASRSSRGPTPPRSTPSTACGACARSPSGCDSSSRPRRPPSSPGGGARGPSRRSSGCSTRVWPSHPQ